MKIRPPLSDRWQDVYDFLIETDPVYLRIMKRLERFNEMAAGKRRERREKAQEIRVKIKELSKQAVDIDHEITRLKLEQYKYVYQSTSPRSREHTIVARRKNERMQQLRKLAEYTVEKKRRRDAWNEMVKKELVPVVQPPPPINARNVTFYGNTNSDNRET